MEKMKFDSGMKQYKLTENGVLSFNPADPNLYDRFLKCGEKIREIEKDLLIQADALAPDDFAGGMALMALSDKRLKEMLSWVFGAHNDFDKILGGVSLLAVGQNGKRVITNLLAALQPALESGARLCAAQESENAVKKAQKRREAQV